MIALVEPQWGVNLLKGLFAWMQASIFWSYWIPIFADVFVFTYPVYLLVLYGYGFFTKHLQSKIAALYIFAGVALSVVANVGIQYFVDKARPNFVLGLTDLKKETILNTFLPSASFPSDHAAVSMSIAVMSLFRGIKNKDKKFLRFGGILIMLSLVTSFARITSGVHRPTDIIGGSLVGIIVPLLLTRNPIYNFGTKIAEKIGKII